MRNPSLLPALIALATVAALSLAPSLAQSPRVISQTQYADRLQAMWTAQCIANWTGLRTEGRHRTPPFLTDADWGLPYNGFTLDYTWYFNPWNADDDTDIEYVYNQEAARLSRWQFTGAEIRDAWIIHINRSIFVSNRRARDLMNRGMVPPATSLAPANPSRLMIDAQLTTELFGAAYPGMPEPALAASELPIRTSAGGYAAHAAQFYVLLYSLASQVDPTLSGREQVLWLTREARRYLPATSKSSDAIDFVLAEYLANPDRDNWELTRDRIYERYQLNAAANGFVYRDWFESTINLATGVMALLYGEGDLLRTIRIGTMSGWDSDNPTATMGGLIGLMGGMPSIEAAFPGLPISDLYDVTARRDGFPDYVPEHPTAEDRLSLMAARVIETIADNVTQCGGLVTQGQWILPPAIASLGAPGSYLASNPLTAHTEQSANVRVRAQGGTVTATCSLIGAPPSSKGSSNADRFADAMEFDFQGLEESDANATYFSTQPAIAPVVELTVEYSISHPLGTVRFIEGDHFADSVGGWFDALAVHVKVGSQWTALSGTWSAPLDPAVPFQILEFTPDAGAPSEVTGVRLVGDASTFITCSELDVVAPANTPQRPTFDLDANGILSIDDLAEFERTPRDLDGNGLVNDGDRSTCSCDFAWQSSQM